MKISCYLRAVNLLYVIKLKDLFTWLFSTIAGHMTSDQSNVMMFMLNQFTSSNILNEKELSYSLYSRHGDFWSVLCNK